MGEPVIANESPGFGGLLRRFRAAAGLTQEELADRAGLSVRGISDLERGLHRRPQPETVRRLVDALGLPEASRVSLLVARSTLNEPGTASSLIPNPHDGSEPGRSSPAQSRLPLPLTSFIGRQGELAELQRLLTRVRLLTLTGTGGVGKTRLALQVGTDASEDYSDGACLAELATIGSAALVPDVVARAVGLREQPRRALPEFLAESLATRQLLLILDNCEHLIDACAALTARLLQICPNLRILATSREPLGVPGEVIWRVPPLSLPPGADSVRRGESVLHPAGLTIAQALDAIAVSEAMRLFVERASAALPGFRLDGQNAAAVETICRRLGGLPLAIELAAARIQVLAPDEIALRLENPFSLLTGGSRTAPPRQQTLRGAIDWSYRLLDPQEQRLFDRLCVFAGSFTLAAAEAVSGDEAGSDREIRATPLLDLLTRLVKTSLVLAEPRDDGRETRYRLSESLRAYGWERLAARGEVDLLRERHAGWTLKLSEEAARGFHGPGEARLLRRLEAEQDNLRSAVRWALERGTAGTALRLVTALNWFMGLRGAWTEGRLDMEQALALPAAERPTTERARALAAGGRLAAFQGDFAVAQAWLDEAVTLGLQLGDEQVLLAARGAAAGLYQFKGEFIEAEQLAEETLARARRQGDTWWEGRMLAFRAQVALRRGDRAAASAHLDTAVRLARRAEDRWSLAMALGELGDVERMAGARAKAGSLYLESLELREGLGLFGLSPSLLHNLGYIALIEGDRRRARHRFGDAVAQFGRIGDRRGQAECLIGLALVAAAEDRVEHAVQLFAAGEAALETLGTKLWISNRDAYEKGVTAACAALGADVFEAVWQRGRQLSLEQALELAAAEPAAAVSAAGSVSSHYPAAAQPQPGTDCEKTDQQRVPGRGQYPTANARY
jgi:predicted ATPase/transcriptional regulator with XRE-family HTH domain